MKPKKPTKEWIVRQSTCEHSGGGSRPVVWFAGAGTRGEQQQQRTILVSMIVGTLID